MKKNMGNPAGVCAPVGFLDVVAFRMMRRSFPTHHFGYGLSASLAMLGSRGFTLTLHRCSAWFPFPSLPPRRGWQRPEHCSQSFVPLITRRHVWVGTPGHHRARMGSLSPYSILLHRPYEVWQEHACSPPGHSIRPPGGLAVCCQRRSALLAARPVSAARDGLVSAPLIRRRGGLPPPQAGLPGHIWRVGGRTPDTPAAERSAARKVGRCARALALRASAACAPRPLRL